MQGVLEIPQSLMGIHEVLSAALTRVQERFDAQLSSDLLAVEDLVVHVERYRGKMLRPALVILAGLAAGSGGIDSPEIDAPTHGDRPSLVSDEHITIAAVCEMVHMATLVHDDVLDEAEIRRRGRTINSLRGNEAAVILGDYLIAASYHLCSQLSDQAASLLIGQTSMTICSGELVQLANRGNLSLDETTYFTILQRKTASLIGTACQLGARYAGADETIQHRLRAFGTSIGIAFQIQDDLLDLTADESVVGKSVGRDLAKGKLTLPVIHLLGTAPPHDRGRALALIESASVGDDGAAAELVAMLDESGSLNAARDRAQSLVRKALEQLDGLPSSPATAYLRMMADAVVQRAF